MSATLQLYNHMIHLPLCSIDNLGSQLCDPAIIDPRGVRTYLRGTYDLTIAYCCNIGQDPSLAYDLLTIFDITTT